MQFIQGSCWEIFLTLYRWSQFFCSDPWHSACWMRVKEKALIYLGRLARLCCVCWCHWFPSLKGCVLPAWPWSYTPAESLCVEIYRSERSNTHVESPSVHTVPRWGMCDLPLTTWSGRWALWLREQSIAAGISWKSLGKFWIFYSSLSSGVHTPLLVKAASFEPTDEQSQLASWTPCVSS